MPIPTIAPYSMPQESELPAAQLTWRPEPSRAALLIHDMQRYFLGFFPAGKPPLSDLVANVAALRDASARLGIPVIYTAQPGDMTRSERGLLHDLWGTGMSADPQEKEIVAELAPRPEDTVLVKWRYSAFHRTELRRLLGERGRDQLIVCGVYAHVGCLLTACDAFSWDIQPFLAADALADFSPQDHRMALEFAAARCGVPLSTRQLIERLER